jgi:hypothetical protein
MHAHLLASGSDARTFALAGNAYFTLVSKATGKRFTYRVAKATPKPGKPVGPSDPYFVSVLTGPQNTKDYTFIGTIFPTNRVQVGGGQFGPVYGNVPAKEPKYVHGKRSPIKADAPSALAFAWAWKKLAAGTLPESLEVWHEGRCGRCGRKLTVPESLAAGLGPECSQTVAVAA